MKIAIFPADEVGLAQLSAFLNREDIVLALPVTQGYVYLPNQTPQQNLYFAGQESEPPARRSTSCYTVYYNENPNVAAPIEGADKLPKV